MVTAKSSKPQLCNHIAMPKNASLQNLTEETIELMAAKFRALGEVSRLRLILPLVKGKPPFFEEMLV